MPEIHEVDPHEETAFRAWYTALHEGAVAGRTVRLAESYLSLVTVATTTDGEPAGYTQIFAPLADPENAMQDDTLVLSPHRGHNLGTLLKVANLRQLALHHTDGRRLHTWTAETNTVMRCVNARLGFRAVEKMHELTTRPCRVGSRLLVPETNPVACNPARTGGLIPAIHAVAEGDRVWRPSFRGCPRTAPTRHERTSDRRLLHRGHAPCPSRAAEVPRAKASRRARR